MEKSYDARDTLFVCLASLDLSFKLVKSKVCSESDDEDNYTKELCSNKHYFQQGDYNKNHLK